MHDKPAPNGRRIHTNSDGSRTLIVPAKMVEVEGVYLTDGAPDIDKMPFDVAVQFLVDDEGMTHHTARQLVFYSHQERDHDSETN
jgi:hypothetical protein